MGLKQLAKADKAAKAARAAREAEIGGLILAAGGAVEVKGVGMVDLEYGSADQAEAVIEAVRSFELVGFRRFAGTPEQLDGLRAAMALRRPAPAPAADPKAAIRAKLQEQGLLG